LYFVFKVAYNRYGEKPKQNQIMQIGNKFELYKIKALLKKDYHIFTRDYLYVWYNFISFFEFICTIIYLILYINDVGYYLFCLFYPYCKTLILDLALDSIFETSQLPLKMTKLIFWNANILI